MEITASLLHEMVLREAENDPLQELDPETYRATSRFLEAMHRDKYDNIEGKVNTALIPMTRTLISLLLKIRLEKGDGANLLDEEKFILDAEDATRIRRAKILDGVLEGRPKLLESITGSHKTGLVAVLFLKGMDKIVGTDMKGYGPFRAEDIAVIPRENARALATKKIAIGLEESP